MLARMMAFSVWLLLGASVAFWALRLLSHPLTLPAAPVAESRSAGADLSRLLGRTPPVVEPEPEAPTQTRLRLLGVAAPKQARAAQAGEGVALIEVDGVARTVRVGATVDGELQLLRVDARSVSLGRAGQAPSQVLQMIPPPPPATGNLPLAAPSPQVLGGNPAAVPGTLSPGAYGGQPAVPPAGRADPSAQFH